MNLDGEVDEIVSIGEDQCGDPAQRPEGHDMCVYAKDGTDYFDRVDFIHGQADERQAGERSQANLWRREAGRQAGRRRGGGE